MSASTDPVPPTTPPTGPAETPAEAPASGPVKPNAPRPKPKQPVLPDHREHGPASNL